MNTTQTALITELIHSVSDFVGARHHASARACLKATDRAWLNYGVSDDEHSLYNAVQMLITPRTLRGSGLNRDLALGTVFDGVMSQIHTTLGMR